MHVATQRQLPVDAPTSRTRSSAQPQDDDEAFFAPQNP